MTAARALLALPIASYLALVGWYRLTPTGRECRRLVEGELAHYRTSHAHATAASRIRH